LEVLAVNEVPSDNKTGDEVFQEEEKKRAERLKLEKIKAEKIKAEKIEAEKLKAEKIKAEKIEAEKLRAEKIEAEKIKEHEEYVRAAFQEEIEAEKIKAEEIKAKKIKAEKLKAEKIKAERIEERNEYVRTTIDQIISDEFIYDRYKIGGFIGRGTYGEVYKAYDQKYRQYVAIKIIAIETTVQREYGEVPLVKMLNRQDPYDKYHIVNLKEDFMWRNCHILVFEWLSINLVELLKQNNHVGESLNDTRIIGTV
jgi:hypothetical protein